MRSFKGLVVLAGIVIAVPSAFADEPPAVLSTESIDDVATAKELNHKGIVLLRAGDYEGALSFFESSRALVRSYPNTRNAASCLDALGRKREALAMWENLLSSYSDLINADERRIIEGRIVELRRELAPPPVPPAIVVSPPVVVQAPTPPMKIVISAKENVEFVRRRASSRWSMGGYLGFATGSSLGSDAEAYVAKTCKTGCPATGGALTGFRVEYQMPRLVTLEVSGGYLRLDSAFTQTWNYLDYKYSVDVERTLAGGFIDFGGSVRWLLNDQFGVVGRLAVGGTFADVTNVLSGSVEGKSKDVGDLILEGDRATIDGRLAYIRPEVALEVKSLPYVLSFGVGAIVAVSTGAPFGELRLRTYRDACSQANIAACAPDLDVSTGNRGYGVFVAFVPQIGVRYHFE